MGKAIEVINDMIKDCQSRVKEYRVKLDAADANNPQASLVASKELTKLVTEIEMLERLKKKLEGA